MAGPDGEERHECPQPNQADMLYFAVGQALKHGAISSAEANAARSWLNDAVIALTYIRDNVGQWADSRRVARQCLEKMESPS